MKLLVDTGNASIKPGILCISFLLESYSFLYQRSLLQRVYQSTSCLGLPNDGAGLAMYKVSRFKPLPAAPLTPRLPVRKSLFVCRMLSHFRTVEHVVPTQHTRQNPWGTTPGHERDLKLVVKQYIPTSLCEPQQGDITIIGAHANGFPKEIYEPLWDDLYERLIALGKRIRSIWIADVANQGESGIVNQQKLGNEPGWFDHARDLLFLINQKQSEMPSPLIGIGHSLGGTQLAHLALLHPSLLHSIILIDPVIMRPNPSKAYAASSVYRRDTWPSLEDARQRFGSSKLFQSWDRRYFEQWIKHGLRQIPTEGENNSTSTDSSSQETPVTLTTPVSQEIFTFLRPTSKMTDPALSPLEDRIRYPDLDEDQYDKDYPFYRPEPRFIYDSLQQIKPNTLYLCGKSSPMSPKDLMEKRLELTGSGSGPSHGTGCQKFLEVLDCGHFVPMEKPKETVEVAARFINSQMDRWEQQRKHLEDQWNQKPREQQVALDDEWMKAMGPRPARSKPTLEAANTKAEEPNRSKL